MKFGTLPQILNPMTVTWLKSKIFIVSAHWRAINSVRHIRPWRSGIRWKHIVIVFFSPYGSPIILVLVYQHQTLSQNSDGVTHCGGAKYRWGIKISRFSTNKSLYLANDTRYCHGYYRRRIGNRTQAFEWHQFQWPWVTSNPDFKVMLLLNVK